MIEGDWVQLHNMLVAALSMLAFGLGYLAGFSK